MWMYEIFLSSMYTRLSASCVIRSIYFTIFCLLLWSLESKMSDIRPEVSEYTPMTPVLIQSGNLTQIDELLEAYDKIRDEVDSAYNVFLMVEAFCFLNISFAIQHVVTYIFTKRMGRPFKVNMCLGVSDFVLSLSSLIFIGWITITCQMDNQSWYLSEGERHLWITANLVANITFEFEYLIMLVIICLAVRVGYTLQL